jgi:hypothetical protein
MPKNLEKLIPTCTLMINLYIWMCFLLKKISCPGSTKILQCSQFVKVHLQHSFHNGSWVQMDSSMSICGNMAGNDVTFRIHCHLLPHLRFRAWCSVMACVYGSTWIYWSILWLFYFNFNNLKYVVCKMYILYVQLSFCSAINYWTREQHGYFLTK